MLENHPYEVIGNHPFTCWEGVNHSKLHLVHTMAEWKAFFALLNEQQLVACDTETTGFQWYNGDRIIGLSFGWKTDHFYVPLRHVDSLQETQPTQLNIDFIKKDLRVFFSDPNRVTVWQNGKFDQHFYAREGIQIRTKMHDTRILWQLFDENAPGALKTIASGWKDDLGRWHKGLVDKDANLLEKTISTWRGKEASLRRENFRKRVMSLADEYETRVEFQHLKRNDLKKYIAENVLNNDTLAKSSKEDIHYGYVPIWLMCQYAALDTFLTYRLYEFCVKNIQWTPQLSSLYRNELSLAQCLFEAEEHGVRIDRDYLIEVGKQYDQEIAALEAQIKEDLGDINLNSVQQLTEALLKVGVKLSKYTESSKDLPDEEKKFALDKAVLSKVKGQHRSVQALLKLRELQKLKSTYVDAILSKLTPEGILHCSFNQNVSTGRMSSYDPNLQNIPARDKVIRRAFIPLSDEFLYVFADYSQIEVRLTAHFSQDPLLLDAYAKNQDIHTRTFCEMFNLPIDEVSKVLKDENHPKYLEYSLLRGVAKRINFGIIYGVGAPGLSEQIERPPQYAHYSDQEWIDVCQGFIDAYLNKYMGVHRFINQSGRLVAKNAKIENYFGRVRHLPHAHAIKLLGNDNLGWMQARARRQGTNFVVQGTAADLFKVAVVRVWKLLKGTKSVLVNFVHDEIQVYLHKDDMHLLPKIKKAMEDWKFAVPIVAEFSSSTKSWGDKKGLAVVDA